ncbi:MAG: C45 family autoproteolytic acyltransferase/hydrolase [Terriglobales bacterium]
MSPLTRIASTVAVLAIAGLAAAPPRAPQTHRLAHSFRRPARNGWIYVHLEGTPRQLGYQNGYWLAPEIEKALASERVTMPRDAHKSWSWLRRAAMRVFWPHVPRQYQQELQGIAAGLRARGSRADLADVLVLNSFQELPDYYVPWYDAHHAAPPATSAAAGPARARRRAVWSRFRIGAKCSAFVATGRYTQGGQVVMGHNNWGNYDHGQYWNIIYDIAPSHGLHILMDGFPGVITSDDDFGINSAGLMVTETTISQFQGFDPNGIPEFVRSRQALQYAHNIRQWIAIMLRGNNGGYANDWLLGDRKTGEIARVELGLLHHKIWRTHSGMYVGANFPSDPLLIRDETTGFNPNDPDSSPNARHRRWEQLKREYKGKIDIAIAEKMESDDYDVVEHKIDPDERTLSGHTDLSPRGVKIWGWGPYYPGGTVSAKVTDSALAAKMEIIGAMGHSDGIGFNAAAFLRAHPQYDWQRPFLQNLPSEPWTLFRAAGE